MHAVVRDEAKLQLAAEGGIECLIFLTVVLQHALQLGLDLLFEVGGDDLQLSRVLQHLAADVQAQVLRVDHAADEAEVLRQQVGAVFHDEHAGGIKLQTGLIVAGVEVVRGLCRDIQQGLIGHGALDAEVQHAQRLLIVKEFFVIEVVVLLLRDILLGLLPDRDHGVERLLLADGLILRLLALLRFVHELLAGDLHADRIADVVGILADKAAQAVFGQIIGILVLVRVGLERQDDVGTGGCALARLHGVAVCALGLPLPGLVAAEAAGNNRDLLGDHECGIEADAELTNDVDIVALLHFLLEAE